MEKPVRALREIISSTLGGPEGGVMSVDSSDSDTRGVSTSSSKISSDMAIKFFFFRLVAHKIFVIIVITKAFELTFSHFGPGQFLDL